MVVEVETFLCLDLSWFGGLEGTNAGEADSGVFGLGYVDDAGGVGAAGADCVDFVDEGEGEVAGEDEVAGDVLIESKVRLCW